VIVFSLHPSPKPTDIVCYYEVTRNSGAVRLGFAAPGYPQTAELGDLACSIALDTASGSVYFNMDRKLVMPLTTASNYWQSETIGCGFNVTTREVFYTRNSQFMGVQENIMLQVYRPSIQLKQSANCKVNFGTHPFMYAPLADRKVASTLLLGRIADKMRIQADNQLVWPEYYKWGLAQSNRPMAPFAMDAADMPVRLLWPLSEFSVVLSFDSSTAQKRRCTCRSRTCRTAPSCRDPRH